jgi:hypothetical protein
VKRRIKELCHLMCSAAEMSTAATKSQCYKTFFCHSRCSKISQSVCTKEVLLARLIFTNEAKSSPLNYKGIIDVPAHIRLAKKDKIRINTLAYFAAASEACNIKPFKTVFNSAPH